MFLHGPKTAGESIELCLNGTRDIDDLDGLKHLNARRFIKKYGCDIWKQYTTFTFVRNPWDRVISWIKYRKKRGRSIYEELTPKVIAEHLSTPHNHFPWFRQFQYYKFIYNECAEIDFIGRFESLQRDFDIICDRIGIPLKTLPHINSQPSDDSKHYTEYYDTSQRKHVEHIYRRDIEMFDYKFGD